MGQKQNTERKEKRKKEKLNDGNNNGQLRIATPPQVAHVKPPGPKHVGVQFSCDLCYFKATLKSNMRVHNLQNMTNGIVFLGKENPRPPCIVVADERIS